MFLIKKLTFFEKNLKKGIEIFEDLVYIILD